MKETGRRERETENERTDGSVAETVQCQRRSDKVRQSAVERVIRVNQREKFARKGRRVGCKGGQFMLVVDRKLRGESTDRKRGEKKECEKRREREGDRKPGERKTGEREKERDKSKRNSRRGKEVCEKRSKARSKQVN